MKIVFLLYDAMTALDAVGPYEVLRCMSDAEIMFAAEQKGPVQTDSALSLMADYAIDEIDAADILLVPGGPGSDALEKNGRVLDWIRKIDATTTYTTSVCTGSLVLGAAGLLKGRRATTHWSRVDVLPNHGAIPARRRCVRDGKYIIAAGVSAGIDMALDLVREMKGAAGARAIRLGIEYYPKPPVWMISPNAMPASWRRALAAKAEAFMRRGMERRKVKA